QQQWPAMPSFPAPDANGGEPQRKVPAAWLIDQQGWKGKRQGSAGVHKNQPLVLVNYQLGGTQQHPDQLGGAGQEAGSGADVLALALQVAADVEQAFGIALQPEVRIWPETAWPDATDVSSVPHI